MRADTFKIYQVLHTWTGVLSGMLLFIAFYAGGLTVFKDELTAWATPPASVPSAEVPLAQAQELIVRTVAAHPEAARDLWLDLRPLGEAPVQRLTWEVRPPEAGEHDALSSTTFTATLRSDGAIDTHDATPSKVGPFVHMLHAVVGLPVDNDLTRSLMGVVAGLYFLALASGLLTFLPRLARDLFALRIDHKLRRMWRDAHLAVGFTSLPFHVVIALTAAVFAFHDPLYGVQNTLIHDGNLRGLFVGPPEENPVVHELSELAPPERLVTAVTDLAPDFHPYALQYAGLGTPRAAVRVWGWDDQGFSFRTLGGFALLDPFTAEIRTTDYLPGHGGPAGTVLSGLFALHFATFGGGFVRGLYLVMALGGAWLFYTGNLLWVEARRKRISRRDPTGRVPAQRPAARRIAALSVGVCVGSMLGISGALLAARWRTVLGVDEVSLLYTAHYSLFLGAIAWAQLRGAPRAAIELLTGTALLTALLPLTSALAPLVPGLWRPPGTLWRVDAVALVFALAFAVLARATARRAASGPIDSVWSTQAQPSA